MKNSYITSSNYRLDDAPKVSQNLGFSSCQIGRHARSSAAVNNRAEHDTEGTVKLVGIG